MKKALVAAILGLATVASTFAQGRINLDTYNTSPYPKITYGADNSNGSSGGTVGAGVTGFNIGIYWIAGAGSIAADATGYATSSQLGGGFTLGTGPGSTSVTGSGGTAGWFQTVADFVMTPLASGGATAYIVAYNGASYDTSTIRGHSAAFTFTPQQLGTAPGVGAFMPAFAVFNAVAVPEPSTFALAGLGLAGLLIFRRRK